MDNFAKISKFSNFDIRHSYGQTSNIFQTTIGQNRKIAGYDHLAGYLEDITLGNFSSSNCDIGCCLVFADDFKRDSFTNFYNNDTDLFKLNAWIVDSGSLYFNNDKTQCYSSGTKIKLNEFPVAESFAWSCNFTKPADSGGFSGKTILNIGDGTNNIACSMEFGTTYTYNDVVAPGSGSSVYQLVTYKITDGTTAKDIYEMIPIAVPYIPPWPETSPSGSTFLTNYRSDIILDIFDNSKYKDFTDSYISMNTCSASAGFETTINDIVHYKKDVGVINSMDLTFIAGNNTSCQLRGFSTARNFTSDSSTQGQYYTLGGSGVPKMGCQTNHMNLQMLCNDDFDLQVDISGATNVPDYDIGLTGVALASYQSVTVFNGTHIFSVPTSWKFQPRGPDHQNESISDDISFNVGNNSSNIFLGSEIDRDYYGTWDGSPHSKDRYASGTDEFGGIPTGNVMNYSRKYRLGILTTYSSSYDHPEDSVIRFYWFVNTAISKIQDDNYDGSPPYYDNGHNRETTMSIDNSSRLGPEIVSSAVLIGSGLLSDFCVGNPIYCSGVLPVNISFANVPTSSAELGYLQVYDDGNSGGGIPFNAGFQSDYKAVTVTITKV